MSNSIENGLIAAVLFILISIPIYLSIRNGRTRKKKKIMDELSLLEKHHSLSFQIIEQLDSFTIVLDRLKKAIVILNLNDYQSTLIDLKQVNDCILEEKKLGKALQQLQLVLLDKKGQPLHQIIFYRQYVDNEGNLTRTSLKAEQWQEMIKAVIADRKPILILEKTT